MSFAHGPAVQDVLRLIDREVWIVTAAAGDDQGGMVATWVSQASLDPGHGVMVLGAAPNHYTAELIDRSNAFALHLITPEQIDLAWNFAIGSGRDRDKLAGLTAVPGLTGSPLLAECLARLECRVFARLATGDRTYYWGQIGAAERRGDATPLREQQLLSMANDAQKTALKANMQHDIAVQTPDWEAWRRELPPLLQPGQ
ncbi:flavin reductase family protein [Lignipirellula cremea]|uniref:Diflavin flavoprotein A 3 n=1 Tax=Lignipirellula cremea TaxID=2528010 RepID=A0A518DZK1_9BACT|nr:flavin reductase family protein [Lignipirellula cremea]QDU97268.1 Putative diflavin flavoprotein A 3 [Lignipirellula cremea]